MVDCTVEVEARRPRIEVEKDHCKTSVDKTRANGRFPPPVTSTVPIRNGSSTSIPAHLPWAWQVPARTRSFSVVVEPPCIAITIGTSRDRLGRRQRARVFPRRLQGRKRVPQRGRDQGRDCRLAPGEADCPRLALGQAVQVPISLNHAAKERKDKRRKCGRGYVAGARGHPSE